MTRMCVWTLCFPRGLDWRAQVLVFDVTLRSFEQMLRQRDGNDLCQCYRRIVRRAAKQGDYVEPLSPRKKGADRRLCALVHA